MDACLVHWLVVHGAWFRVLRSVVLSGCSADAVLVQLWLFAKGCAYGSCRGCVGKTGMSSIAV